MATKHLTIGNVAKLSGLSAATIRFYEDEGYIPAAHRSDAGYRLYSETDLQRLRLIRRARLLGVPLTEVRELTERAFAGDCSSFAAELMELVERRRNEIDRQMAELEALRRDLDSLEEHIDHCGCGNGAAAADCCQCGPGSTAADCAYCLILDEEGGD